jgi:hypothetical protein
VTLKTLTETNNAYSIVINSDTDASAAAADLNIVDGKTTVAINASAVETLTGLAADVQASYVANAGTGITGLGNESVTLADTVLAAATLNSIDSSTTGLVDAGTALTLTGTASDVLAAYVADAANSASGITGLGDEAVTLSGTASATALTSIDSYTTGLVNASAVTTLVGTYAEVQAAFAAAGITGLGSVVVELTDSLMSASALNDANSKTTGVVDASSVQTLTGAASDVQSAYIADAGAEITGLGNELVTLSDATLAATLLNSIDSYNTGGLVDASSVQTLTGAGADVLAAYQSSGANGITGLGDERVTLSDTTLAAATLHSIDSYTTGLVDASAVTTITGSYADVLAAYSASGANGITGLGDEAVTLSGSTSVLDANTVAARTSGVVTATIDVTAVSTLVGDLTDGQVNAYTITVVDSSVNAADLNNIDSKTSVVVDASSVGTLTGAAADVLAAYTSSGITGLGDERVELSDTTLAVTLLNEVNSRTTDTVDASSVVMLTGAASDVLTAYESGSLAQIDYLGDELVVLDAGSVESATLNSIDSYTTGLVDASAVTTITGSYADVLAAYSASGANGITGLGDEAVELTGSVTVAQANEIAAYTSGVVTATISTDDLSALTGLTETGNAYTITVAAGSASAAQLNTVDGKTTVAVNAGNVTTLTGAFADVLAAYDANTGAGITGLGNAAVELAGSVTVAESNQITGATLGLVTATISEGTLSTLKNLAADDNLTVTVTDTSAAAADLIAVDTATRLAVDASAVQTLTGTAADVVTVYQANAGTGITGLGNEAVTLSDATLAAAALNSIDTSTGGEVNVSSALTISGSGSDVLAAYEADAADTTTGITGLGDEAVTLSDATLAAGTLNSIDTSTEGEVDAGTAQTLTGSGSDVLAAYEADAADTATGITGLGDEAVTLTGTTLAADTLNSIDSSTSGVVDAGSIQTLTGFADALITAYLADGGAAITGLGNEDLVITGGTLSSTQLMDLYDYSSGDIDATAVDTLTADGSIDLGFINGRVDLSFSTIDMLSDTAAQTLNINFAAALESVGNGNTLTIDGGNNDTVNLNGFSATGYDFDGDGTLDSNYNDGIHNYYWGTDGTNIVIVKVLMDVTTTPTP